MKLWFKKTVVGGRAEPATVINASAPENAPASAIKPEDRSQPVSSSEPARPSRATPPDCQSDHKSLYKQLLAGLYDAVLVTDPKGHVIDVNARVREFFLYDNSETWDMAVGKLIPGVNMALIERIKQGLSGDRFVLLDVRCVRKDRTTFAAEVAISSINLMDEGDFVFSVRNIERRRGMLQKLRSSHNALMQALSADASCDRQGCVKMANPALLALWGYEREEDLVGKQLVSLWAQDAENQDVADKVLAGETWQGSIQATARNGVNFQVRARMAPERNGHEGIVGLVCSFLECTPHP